ncbi:MAG: ABC transporter permease [Vicinamibacteraceae bacterium]
MRLLRWLARARWDRERSRELESYLDVEAADNVARGISPADARDAARRKLGNLTRIREEIHEMNGIGWLDRFSGDLRYAARTLRGNAGFATVAIMSLALGIGANTAIFQLLDAVRLRTLPVVRPQEIVQLRIAGGNSGMGMNGPFGGLTRPQWEEIGRQQQAVDLFAWSIGGARVGPEQRGAPAVNVSAGYFPVLGVPPWRGRFFTSADDEATCPATRAVVSYDYWQREMGGVELTPASRLLVDGRNLELIGVAPPGFRGLVVGDRFDVAFPLCRPREVRNDVFHTLVMGRLRDGWSAARATEHLRAISPGIMAATQITGYTDATHRQYREFKLEAAESPRGVSELRERYDTSLWLLLAITGLVLLIACANIANLMLARATAREREIAVRLAIGASRRRLIAQLLTESALIAAVGAALGVAVAAGLSRVLVAALSSENRQIALTLDTDWRVFGFATIVAALTCVVFGLAPAFRGTRAAPVDAMKSGGRGSTDGRERYALQRVLVIGQIAVSLVLLVGAALFVRSFYNLTTFDAGVRQEGISVVFMGFGRDEVPRERVKPLIAELVAEVRALPGVENVATTTHVPLMGGSWGHGVKAGVADESTRFTWVSPTYFATVDQPLLAGRRFSETDTPTSAPVAIVNEAFLRTFFPRQPNPLGKTLMQYAEPDYPETVYEIVGVVKDAQYNGLRGDVPPSVLVPASQFPAPQGGLAMLIRSANADAMLATVRRHLKQAHPQFDIDGVVLQQRVRESLVRERLMALLSGFFGVLAALLATIGLYGVIAYIMQRRRNEVGIRLALGAQPGQIVRMVLRDAGMLVVVGVAVGTALAVVAGRGAETLLFGLRPTDVATFAGATLLLATIAFVASAIPAMRAARVDPMRALRQD